MTTDNSNPPDAALQPAVPQSDPAVVQLALARSRLGDDDIVGAEEAARRALALNPRLGEAEVIVARARLRGDDLVAAEEAARRALALNPRLGEAELIVARIRLRGDDPIGAEEAAKRALALNPRLGEAEAIVARARLRGNDLVGAEEAARRALALNPQLSEAELAVARARLRGEDPAGAQEAAKRALALNPQLAEGELILAEASLRADDPAGAEAAALDALSRNPRLTQAAMLAAQAANRQGEVDKTVAHLRRLAELAPDDPRWPLKIAETLNFGGRVEEARRGLAAVRERWPSNRLVEYFLQRSALGGDRIERAIRTQPNQGDGAAAAPPARGEGWEAVELRPLLETSPGDSQLLRPVVVDLPEKDLLTAECPGAETLVIAFTGTNDRMWIPITLFDRYLAALGVSAVYLKDFRRLLFVKGILSLGERYEDTLAGLGELARRFHARRVCTIGNSGGARPAIRYGVDLGAANIVGFAAATGPQPCLNVDRSQGDQIVNRRVLQHASGESLDLRPFLMSRRLASKITLFYSATSQAEAANARHLSGIEGVSLCPVDGPSPTILSLAKQAGFLETLAEALGCPAVPRRH